MPECYFQKGTGALPTAAHSGTASYTTKLKCCASPGRPRALLSPSPVHSPLQIDVLVLYSTDTFAAGEETQWVTNIVTGFATANEATANSGIDLKFNLVRVDQVSERRAARGGRGSQYQCHLFGVKHAALRR